MIKGLEFKSKRSKPISYREYVKTQGVGQLAHQISLCSYTTNKKTVELYRSSLEAILLQLDSEGKKDCSYKLLLEKGSN